MLAKNYHFRVITSLFTTFSNLQGDLENLNNPSIKVLPLCFQSHQKGSTRAIITIGRNKILFWGTYPFINPFSNLQGDLENLDNLSVTD